MLQHGKAVYNMVQLILDLAFVFVVHMGIAQMAELLRLLDRNAIPGFPAKQNLRTLMQ